MTIEVPALATDILLLLVRLVIAVAFAVSARNKFRDMKAFAKNNGMPLGVSYLIAIAELCAAIGMVTGVLAQWAGIGLVLLMLGTMSLHIFKWHSPYWANKGGWEYDLMLCLFAGMVVVLGPGAFTVLF